MTGKIYGQQKFSLEECKEWLSNRWDMWHKQHLVWYDVGTEDDVFVEKLYNRTKLGPSIAVTNKDQWVSFWAEPMYKDTVNCKLWRAMC